MTPDEDVKRPTPPAGRHVETLRDSQREARAVLDQQLATLSEVHEKAMRTVRVTVLLLGVVFSAVTFPAGTTYVNWLTLFGTVSLTLAILFGLWTYASSSPEIGPSTNHFEEAYSEGYTEAEWRTFLLVGYTKWIASAEELNSANARMLTVCQALLGLGVLLLTVGTVLVVFGHLDPVIRVGA